MATAKPPNRVSRRAIASLMDRARGDLHATSVIVQHSGSSPDEWLGGSERIDWSSFRAILEAARVLWGESAISAAGGDLLELDALNRFAPLVRKVVSPVDLYRWVAHPRLGLVTKMFPGARCGAWEVTPEQITFELELAPEHEPFPELFILVRALLARVPTVLGQPSAEVTVETGRLGALFHVRSKHRDTFVARARRALRNARRLRVAVEELRAAHDLLNRQYDELRVTQRALRESEERFRALIENSSDFILLSDRAGRLTYLSPSAGRITGFDPEALIGSVHGGLAHPDDRSALESTLARLTAAPGKEATVRFRFHTRSQKWIWLEGTAKNMLDDPTVSAVLVNYRDVTDRVHLEEQLLQSRKLESIGRLAGGIAHDFNNILTGVMGNSQLALNKLDSDHPSRDNITQVIDYARRASDLTGQLLSFARRQIVQPKRISLNTSILEARALLGRLIGDQVEIVTILDPDLGTIRIDPSQLQQLIVNLAINARDAMASGGALTISTENVCARGEDPEGQTRSYALLSVSDTGAGMDDETLSRIFDPFFTTKELGRGTGLGLATCHGIVSQAGGRIEVQTRLGVGTTFRVLLPRVDGDAEPARNEELGDAPRGTETILLVEDDRAVRQATAELLRGLGYRVITAVHGADALVVVDSGVRPAAVVTDVVMPRLTGPQLVKKLRELYPNIGVLYVSGYANEMPPTDAPLVHKPFGITELAIKLRNVLDAIPDQISATCGGGS